jgi:hypothetical protein
MASTNPRPPDAYFQIDLLSGGNLDSPVGRHHTARPEGTAETFDNPRLVKV